MRTLTSFALGLLVSACGSQPVATTAEPPSSLAPPAAETASAVDPAMSADSSIEVVLASAVTWEHLNPARGDKAPSAGTLWGDRNGTGPTGYLLKPKDGFESPPHIHNVSYRGVVISGLIHNASPKAEVTWMSAGSFWTQPKGGVHITAAKGNNTLAYIEIEEGPYLVLPIEKAFDNGEAPKNVGASNIVWAAAAGMPASAAGPRVAALWGQPKDGQLNGSLVELPPGFVGSLRSRGSIFGAVVIQGRPTLRIPGEADSKAMTPGSYVRSTGPTEHPMTCGPGEACVLYVRTDSTVDIVQADAH